MLSDELLQDSLQALNGWSGTPERISRTVTPPAEHVDELLAAVQESGDAMDHHAEVERDGERITFVLWTHSEGGVTELDITMASHIDDLLAIARHEGVVPGQASEEEAMAETEGASDPGYRTRGRPEAYDEHEQHGRRRDVHVDPERTHPEGVESRLT